MAISATHWSILQTLKSRNVLPQGCRILEIGEANYYGDFDPREVFEAAGEECDPKDVFGVAKLIYKAMFNVERLDAIDAGGPTALHFDLNGPVPLNVNPRPLGAQTSDVTYNHGTAEHVFNIAQVFRTMHEATVVGGLMIHESPFTGWVDHGFYCLQPTLFWDLAAANQYTVEFAAVEHMASRSWREVGNRDELIEAKRRDELPDNAMLFIVLRKTVDAEFHVPQQGVYSGQVSQAAKQAWKELR